VVPAGTEDRAVRKTAPASNRLPRLTHDPQEQRMTAFPATVHHVALTVTDLEASRAWYRRLLETDPVVDEDVPDLPGHHKGFHHTIFVLPSGCILALHAHHGGGRADRFDELRSGLDHIGFGCADRVELERLQARLDELGIQHGGIADDSLGHGLSFRDPDNIALEFWAPRT
jgi:catechol 2,3-dioxygenase-like lactoylglutathione lyase family enzyme